VENTDSHHEKGQCRPTQALGGETVDAVVVGGIGGGALQKLQAEGIKVFRAVAGDVAENLELVKSGKLPEFVMDMTCAGHRIGGGCHH
jgi:predicted Fe-Mo cluster-binding NifX family protein